MRKPTLSGAGDKAAYLLDTSTLLWALGSGERLSRRARRLIDAGPNVLSVVSYWEIVIKTQKGLLSIADLPTWWQRAVDVMAARQLSIRASHISTLASLPAVHKDPFDRMLIAQALAEGLDFVTSDAQAAAYPIRTIW